MICYVAHKFGGDTKNAERAKQTTHDLQIEHPTDCFICPILAFSHLGYNELGRDAEMEICLDLLSVCDKLIVASEVSEGVQREIDFARLIDMEVEYIEPQHTRRCD